MSVIDPVSDVRFVHIDKVSANDYNPNQVAKRELFLLYISIKVDGYTQPVVTIHDEQTDKYIIVDGFHRYLVMKTYSDIAEARNSLLPVVVLRKNLAERMQSTIRHNRARGKHSVMGMSNIVFSMLDEGMTDQQICVNLGMEADELLRLKHITGFSKLFENVGYKKAWESRYQIKAKQEWDNANRKNGNQSDQALLEKPKEQ